MQMPQVSKHESQALTYSVSMLALGVAAIAAFVLLGGGVVFYVLATATIAVGFYMSYHLSKAPQQAQETEKRTSTKRRR